jgi:hypothetical protein
LALYEDHFKLGRRKVMKNAKPLLIVVAVVSVGFLLLGVATLSVKAENLKPHKPVPATDVVLVKKVTLKGGHPGGGGRKKSAEAATGFLGARCTGTKYAIVIGISDYPGDSSDLEYADDDADEMASVLVSAYGFDAVNITVLENGSANDTAIMGAIAAVEAQADSDDEVVFFFSGHGMSGKADDGDGEKVDEAIVSQNEAGDEFVPIWDGELEKAFAGFKTDRIVFIFDSCLAGGMDDLEGTDRVVLMACAEHGYSYEGDQWGNGEFTYYLAQYGIGLGEANIHDYDDDHKLSEPDQVTAEEAFDYAKANCRFDRPVIADSFADDLLP